MKERIINIAEKITENANIRRTAVAVLTCCAALGWWGAVYPQFTLLSGTYRIVDEEDGAGQTDWHQMDCDKMDWTEWAADVTATSQRPAKEKDTLTDKGTLYWQILGADREHIRMKSRLWEDWKALWGAEREHYESGEE